MWVLAFHPLCQQWFLSNLRDDCHHFLYWSSQTCIWFIISPLQKPSIIKVCHWSSKRTLKLQPVYHPSQTPWQAPPIVSHSNPLDAPPTSPQPLSGHITIREQKCFNVKQNTLWFHLVLNASYWSRSEIKAPSRSSQAIFSSLSPHRPMSLHITPSLRSNLRHFVFSCYCSFWSNVPVSFLSQTPAPFLRFERFWPTASCHLLMQSISLSSTLMSNGCPNQL